MTRLLGLMPLTALLVGAVSGAAGVASPARGDTGSPGRFGIRLVDAPVARRHDPRARTGIVDHLRPGATIRAHGWDTFGAWPRPCLPGTATRNRLPS